MSNTSLFIISGICLHSLLNIQSVLSTPGRPKSPVGRPSWTSDDSSVEFSTALFPYVLILIIFPISLLLVCVCATYSIRWLTRKLTNHNRHTRRHTTTLFFPLAARERNANPNAVYNGNNIRNVGDVEIGQDRTQLSTLSLFGIQTTIWSSTLNPQCENYASENETIFRIPSAIWRATLSRRCENDPPPKYSAEEPPPSYESLFFDGNKD